MPEPTTRDDGDHEYDLAHEVATDRLPAPAAAEHGAPVYVATQTGTAGDHGDYGYDLAHDVPRLDRA